PAGATTTAAGTATRGTAATAAEPAGAVAAIGADGLGQVAGSVELDAAGQDKAVGRIIRLRLNQIGRVGDHRRQIGLRGATLIAGWRVVGFIDLGLGPVRAGGPN